MVESIFKAVLSMSLVGTVLTAIIMIAKPVTQKIFGFKWQYYIWYAVLVVMLLPFSVNIVTPNESTMIGAYKHEGSRFSEDFSIVSEVDNSHETQPEQETPIKYDTLFKAIAYIWLLYGSSVFVFKIFQYFLYLHIVRKKSVCFRKSGRIQIWYTSLVSAPLTLGLISKKILVPQGIEDEKAIDFILLHEGTHIKHGDIFFKWLCMILKCVHWFNPVVYFLAKETEQLCEIVCDIDVAKNMDESERKAYMNTILSLVSSSLRNVSELTTNMANAKSCIAKRFAAIVSLENREMKQKRICAAVTVVTVLLLFGLSAIAGGKLWEDSPFCITLALKGETQKNHTDNDIFQNSETQPLKDDEDTASPVIEENSSQSVPRTEANNVLTENIHVNNRNPELQTRIENKPPYPFGTNTGYPASVYAQPDEGENMGEKADYDENHSEARKETSEADSSESFSKEEESEKPLDEKYPYGGQIRFEGLTYEKITEEIDITGGGVLCSDNAGLGNGYIPGKLSYKNDGVATHDNIKSDEKGHITFYMESDYDQHVNITFNKDGEQIAGYGIIPDNETTYVFGGFNPGEEYDIEISTSTGGTWMIESDYLLY